MKECLDVLQEAKEAPGDAMLAQMVRAQLVVDKVIKELGHDFEVLGDAERKAPLSVYVKGLQAQIDDVRNSTPPELFQNSKCFSHCLDTHTDTSRPSTFTFVSR